MAERNPRLIGGTIPSPIVPPGPLRPSVADLERNASLFLRSKGELVGTANPFEVAMAIALGFGGGPFKMTGHGVNFIKGKFYKFSAEQKFRPLSKTEQANLLPEKPFVVINPRAKTGIEGIFQTEKQALDFIKKSGNRHLDILTPKDAALSDIIMQKVRESPEFMRQKLEDILQQMRAANEP